MNMFIIIDVSLMVWNLVTLNLKLINGSVVVGVKPINFIYCFYLPNLLSSLTAYKYVFSQWPLYFPLLLNVLSNASFLVYNLLKRKSIYMKILRWGCHPKTMCLNNNK